MADGLRVADSPPISMVDGSPLFFTSKNWLTVEIWSDSVSKADGPSGMTDGPQVFFLTGRPNGGPFLKNHVLRVLGHFIRRTVRL